MKKFLLSLALVFLLVLTGCEKNKKVMVTTCTLSNNDTLNGYQLNSTYKIYSTNNEVNKVESKEVVSSSSAEILNLFEKTLSNTYKTTNDTYGGYTYSITNENSKVTAITTIDYKQINLDKYIKDNTVMKQYVNKNGNLTVDAIKQIYTNLGASCE